MLSTVVELKYINLEGISINLAIALSAPSAMKISDLIRRAPVIANPTATVEEAVKIMYRENVGSVIVVSPEGFVLGIFTERDLVRVIGEGKPLSTKVGDVMTRNPITIFDDEHLAKAVMLMAERRIRHLPIVDREGRLKGVISARDIAGVFRKYAEELGEINE